MAVEYRLLGPVEALRDGAPVALGGPRQRGVLVALLTRADTLVHAVRVIDDLWDDDPPASGRASSAAPPTNCSAAPTIWRC